MFDKYLPSAVASVVINDYLKGLNNPEAGDVLLKSYIIGLRVETININVATGAMTLETLRKAYPPSERHGFGNSYTEGVVDYKWHRVGMHLELPPCSETLVCPTALADVTTNT